MYANLSRNSSKSMPCKTWASPPSSSFFPPFIRSTTNCGTTTIWVKSTSKGCVKNASQGFSAMLEEMLLRFPHLSKRISCTAPRPSRTYFRIPKRFWTTWKKSIAYISLPMDSMNTKQKRWIPQDWMANSNWSSPRKPQAIKSQIHGFSTTRWSNFRQMLRPASWSATTPIQTFSVPREHPSIRYISILKERKLPFQPPTKFVTFRNLNCFCE